MARDKRPAKSYYPVFLDVDGRDCLVVGGGRVAERKARSLLEAGARVRVVSPALTKGLVREKERGRIRHAARPFRPSDLKGAFLVIAATDSEEDNKNIAASGAKLVNVVDKPALCTFIVPSTIKRGPLQIAISTSGASPAMARAIREELEALYGPAFGRHLRRLSALRKKAAVEIKDPKERGRYLKSLASPGTLKELRGGKAPRQTMAMLKNLALGKRQIEEGRVEPAADVVRRIREGRSGR